MKRISYRDFLRSMHKAYYHFHSLQCGNVLLGYVHNLRWAGKKPARSLQFPPEWFSVDNPFERFIYAYIPMEITVTEAKQLRAYLLYLCEIGQGNFSKIAESFVLEDSNKEEVMSKLFNYLNKSYLPVDGNTTFSDNYKIQLTSKLIKRDTLIFYNLYIILDNVIERKKQKTIDNFFGRLDFLIVERTGSNKICIKLKQLV